jgi:hypothetical protein
MDPQQGRFPHLRLMGNSRAPAKLLPNPPESPEMQVAVEAAAAATVEAIPMLPDSAWS